MISRKVRIKIGTDVHELVENEHPGCSSKCSLEGMCMYMGSKDHALCSALIREHGELRFDKGHFEKIKS